MPGQIRQVHTCAMHRFDYRRLGRPVEHPKAKGHCIHVNTSSVRFHLLRPCIGSYKPRVRGCWCRRGFVSSAIAPASLRTGPTGGYFVPERCHHEKLGKCNRLRNLSAVLDDRNALIPRQANNLIHVAALPGQCRRILASAVTGKRACGRWGRASRHPFLSNIEPPHKSSFSTEMIGSSRSFLGM